MTAIELLRSQLSDAHHAQEATIAGLTQEQLDFSDTGKAIPAGAAYAHSVIAEDMVLSTMLTDKKQLAPDADTGLSEPMPQFSDWEKHAVWIKSVKIDFPKLHAFAQTVYKTTDDWLATLTDADLDKEVERPMVGKHPFAFFITNFLILHIANLTGEISAAKGMQDLKGYPF